MTQKTITRYLILFFLTTAAPGLAWAGNHYCSSTFENSYSRSWDENRGKHRTTQRLKGA